MNPLVIDLSHWNPTPDWNALYKAGTVGVILKATEGTSYVDETWRGRAFDAMAAGLKVATYHFLRPGDMVAQMDHYISETDTLMPLGSRVCLDHEDEDVSLGDLLTAVSAIQMARPDLQIAIYSGHLIKDQLGAECNEALAETSLWIAHYTSNESPTWPYQTWPMWSLWQYTDSETVEGVSDPVDANRWNGTEEHLLEWFGPAGGSEPIPEPQPQHVVTVAIEAPTGVQVIVRVNGEEILK